MWLLVVLSCKVGCRKPEMEIFAIAAERAGVRPEENLLIDDVPENCMAARQCGWESVHFKDNSSAVTEVIAVLQRQEIFL